MGKISQAKAQEASIEICKALQKQIDEKSKEIGEYMKSIVMKENPDVVMTTFNKYPEWFNAFSSITVQGNGFSYFSVSWVGAIPTKGHSSYYEISKEASVKLHKLNDERNKIKDLYKKTQVDIENTILALGTHKRVEEQFPEAYEFVAEKSTTQALMLNIAPIRQITCILVPGCDAKKVKKELSELTKLTK